MDSFNNRTLQQLMRAFEWKVDVDGEFITVGTLIIQLLPSQTYPSADILLV